MTCQGHTGDEQQTPSLVPGRIYPLNCPTMLPHPGWSWLFEMWTKCQGKRRASQWSLPIEIRGLNKSWISCSLDCGTEMLFCSKCTSLGEPRRETPESSPRAASLAPGSSPSLSSSSISWFPSFSGHQGLPLCKSVNPRGKFMRSDLRSLPFYRRDN